MRQVRRLNQLQQSDIALFIAADQFGIEFTAIVELDADLLRLINDVIIGQHVAFRCVDDDTGAKPFKRLRLLLRGVIAKIFLQLFRHIERRRGSAFHLHADHRRQDFFQHRRQAR